MAYLEKQKTKQVTFFNTKDATDKNNKSFILESVRGGKREGCFDIA